MSDPILVRGEISKGVAWSRTLVPLGVVLGAALFWFAPFPIGLIVGAVFAIWWIWVEIYVARQRYRQLWLRDTGGGFDLIDRTGERNIPDASITSVALKFDRVYSNGVLSATKRRFTIWTDLEPETLLFESTIKPKQTDPLANLIARVMKNFQERTETNLHNGDVLAGVDWQLDRQTLTWGHGEAKGTLSRKDISACEEFDGNICVWRKGRDEAVVRFKLGTQNGCLLPILLQVVDSDEGPATHEDQSGLGRILFERKPGKGEVIGVGCLGIGLLIIGGFIISLGVGIVGELVMVFIGLAVVLVSLLVLYWGYTLRFKSFRCHERGVIQLGVRSRKELRYEETGAFTYSAIRQHQNGSYIGTAISMNFTPLPESKAPKISYGTTIKNEDAAIEELRNFISRAIAGRMAERLSSGQEVPWTPNLTFTLEGILYRPPGFIGRKDAKLMAYTDYGGYNMEQGIFYLFQRGEKKSVTNEQASAVNFYPGFFLLLMMQE